MRSRTHSPAFTRRFRFSVRSVSAECERVEVAGRTQCLIENFTKLDQVVLLSKQTRTKDVLRLKMLTLWAMRDFTKKWGSSVT